MHSSIGVNIRSELPADAPAIAALTTAAFLTAEHSRGNEALIVDALRASGSLAVSLVAVDANRIIGHVAFSPVTIDGRDLGWVGLGPVSVAPDRQRKGIGTTLIESGLALLREQDARGCVVLGDPAYYRRFGFASDPELYLEGVPTAYFQSLSFDAKCQQGRVQFHAAFEVD